MSKEQLYAATRIGAFIPWALFAAPLGDATISFSLLLFQLVCLDLKIRYENSN